MKEIKTFKKDLMREKIAVGDVVETKEFFYSPQYITIRDNTLKTSKVVKTDVKVIYLQRVDKVDSIALDCHFETKVDLVSEQLPKNDCSIWFEDEEEFVFFPNVKRISDSIGNCCCGNIDSDNGNEVEASVVLINKERVFRNEVNKFIESNKLH